MSRVNYEIAMKNIEENMSACFFAGEKTEGLIKKAELALDFKFSPQIRAFFRKFGAGSIGSEEIYGVINDDFVSSSVPNGVWFTLIERKEINMPKHLYVVFDTGSDEFICQDYSNMNDDGEPRIVLYYPGADNESQPYEVVADDFGNYLLEITSEEL